MSTTRVLIFDKDGKDVSDDLELKNKKANPFGWSQSEIWHGEKQIGWIESGSIDLSDKDYTFTETIEP